MKIMEIINKTDDFKQDVCRLELLDTTFTEGGKLLGTDPNKNWEDTVDGDIVSVEGLQSLREEQRRLAEDVFPSFRNAFDSWVISVEDKVELAPFSVVMKIPEWAKDLEAGVDVASFHTVLKKLAGAEKVLYQGSRVHAKNHMVSTRTSLQEWSKDKRYWDTVSMYQFVEFEYYDNVDHWLEDDTYTNCKFTWIDGTQDKWNGDKITVQCHILNPFAIGESYTCRITHEYGYSGSATVTCVDAGSGVGTYEFSYNPGGNFDHPNNSPVWHYRGTPSAHFDSGGDTPDKLNLPWLQSRVLL